MGQEPPSPGFDAAQLAETLDTIGLLVASLSDRVDAQGKILEKVHQTATEARAAAFAAEKARDWEKNGDLINQGISRGTRQVDKLVEVIGNQLDLVTKVFKKMAPLLAEMELRDQARREKRMRWRRWRPAFLAGAILAIFVLALVAVHVVGRSGPLCALLGGTQAYLTGTAAQVCAFSRW